MTMLCISTPYTATEQIPAERRGLFAQCLTMKLDGITAGDYLAWVRDPEPPALGRDLRSITVHADPLAAEIDLALGWDREPPPVSAALLAAGFPATPEVIGVDTTLPRPMRKRRRRGPKQPVYLEAGVAPRARSRRP